MVGGRATQCVNQQGSDGPPGDVREVEARAVAEAVVTRLESRAAPTTDVIDDAIGAGLPEPWILDSGTEMTLSFGEDGFTVEVDDGSTIRVVPTENG